MTGADWLLLVAIGALFLVSGVLAMAETAFTRMSRVRALALKEEGRSGATRLTRLLERPERTLNSLLLVMTGIWIASWLAQSVTGRVAYNANQLDHQAAPVSWLHYLATSDFWNRTLQNWQSEFLAVGSMCILSVYLRQRGSPESKPVGAPHAETGTEG